MLKQVQHDLLNNSGEQKKYLSFGVGGFYNSKRNDLSGTSNFKRIILLAVIDNFIVN
jgi:hypothetical protein